MRPALLALLLAACGGVDETAPLEAAPAPESIAFTHQAVLDPFPFYDSTGEAIGWLRSIYLADVPIDCSRSLPTLLDDGVLYVDARTPLDATSFDGAHDGHTSAIVALGPFAGLDPGYALELSTAAGGGLEGQLDFSRDGRSFRVRIDAEPCRPAPWSED